jgi:hypothetical protein
MLGLRLGKSGSREGKRANRVLAPLMPFSLSSLLFS